MRKTQGTSSQFDLRFHARKRNIRKRGDVSIEDAEPINRSGDVLMKGKGLLPPISKAQHALLNVSPTLSEVKPVCDQLGALGHRSGSNVSFQPYTLADYKRLVNRTPQRMGGLGPSNMGSEEWCAAWRLRHKRLTYSLKAD